ncbi:hypothetical protein [Ekhidna sp.]|jgi:glucosamine kinase|uniref:hypothetical protein n=1 Tax=Ekhidna sp. TaxID=2608089 RepID=UPI0032EA9C38
MADSFIVGDAGGTSTQWRVVKGENIQQFETIGFNAYTHNVNDLKTSISQTFGKEIEKEVPVYFYAAGVDTDEQTEEVKKELSEVFDNNIQIENDLLGVARGLCGKEEGNVCILGTGANACFYNGHGVNKVSASLGYVLGDEGSGAYLGKKMMTKIFRGQFSEEIITRFQDKFELTSHQVIQQIYHQPKPNHFLASFAKFIYDNRNHPEIHQLITQSFNDFFDAFFHSFEYHSLPFHFSGSIAYYFSDILREVGNERGFLIRNVVQSPIAGLVLYHQKHG